MKKLLLSLMVIMATLPFFVNHTEAAYVNESDKTISIQTGLNLRLPLSTTQTSFQLQELLHNSITATTGLEIDHYYYWVELDGQTVLGIDPAKPMY